jgi:hypothetical protein
MAGADQRRTMALAADEAPQLDALPAQPPLPQLPCAPRSLAYPTKNETPRPYQFASNQSEHWSSRGRLEAHATFHRASQPQGQSRMLRMPLLCSPLVGTGCRPAEALDRPLTLRSVHHQTLRGRAACNPDPGSTLSQAHRQYQPLLRLRGPAKSMCSH